MIFINTSVFIDKRKCFPSITLIFFHCSKFMKIVKEIEKIISVIWGWGWGGGEISYKILEICLLSSEEGGVGVGKRCRNEIWLF